MKIRLKLTLLFSGLFAILLLAFSLAVYFYSANQREEEYYKRLRQLAITKTNLLLRAHVEPSVLQLIYENSLNTLPQEEVAIYDTSYHLLYHDAMEIDKVKETTGMIDSIIGRKEIHFYVGDLQAVGFVYLFENKRYVITAAARDDEGLSKLKTLALVLVVGFAMAILLTLLAGILFSRKALAPVAEMVGKVEAISASHLDLRIDAGNGRDEIAELAQTFNRMLNRLESSFNAQKDFVSNISHELRTPLAAIIAELEVSAILERTTHEYKEIIQQVLIEARKLSRLSNDLLDLAKASYDYSGITFKELRLDEVLLDATQGVLRSNPGYRVELLFEKEMEESEGISIKGNEYLLKVAFANLIENACKFSGGHSCTVAISFEGKDPVLRFSDRGIGISPSDLSRIFTPFYRGENKKYADGNGIGLSLTARIIHLHNGTISVESIVGEGTSFTIRLSQS
ncbi:MAG TPA: HAMP domain-containing sensor histidine kinase [Puia sp.]|jgi:signal transduction histidine kinase|nr:HAMP domain-containing sensor histidine kinase [Puia sp.]